MPFRNMHVVSPVRGKAAREGTNEKTKARICIWEFISITFMTALIPYLSRTSNVSISTVAGSTPTFRPSLVGASQTMKNDGIQATFFSRLLQREKLIFGAIVWMKKKSFNLILGEWRWSCLGISFMKKRKKLRREENILFIKRSRSLALSDLICLNDFYAKSINFSIHLKNAFARCHCERAIHSLLLSSCLSLWIHTH